MPPASDVFLFNLKEDLAEMVNVADEYPDIVSELKKEYEEFSASLPSGQ